MTKADRPRRRSGMLAAAILIAALGGGVDSPAGNSAASAASPRRRSESRGILRESPAGPILVAYASAPLTPDAPPDGVRTALARAAGNNGRLSAAAFYWEEREAALAWIRGQMEERRRRGQRPRVILAGHGTGATEASETARELLFHERDFEISLLLTVDAVKVNRYGASAAYAAGNAIVNRLPGVRHSFTAYDAAPAPDGVRVRAHINYYQNKSTALHGAAMPHAENHRIADWTGLLNHDNAADFVMPNLTADLRSAVGGAGRAGGDAFPGPRISGAAGKGGDEILRGVNSGNREERMTALRAAAARAGELRRGGDARGARSLEDAVIRRYGIEREQAVRACVVTLCAPAAGRSAAMVRFLRERIAAGEFPGYAALSLAAMAPKTAFDDIAPLTRHPAPDVRLQAATALTVLGDPRGREPVRRVLNGMEPGLWPENIDGVTLDEARKNLAAQARRAFGGERAE